MNEALRRGDASAEVRAEQGALEEGVDRLLDQVKEISGKNAPGLPAERRCSRGRQDQMRRARDALANAAPNAREGCRPHR